MSLTLDDAASRRVVAYWLGCASEDHVRFREVPYGKVLLERERDGVWHPLLSGPSVSALVEYAVDHTDL